jgi:hypothetical protein
MMERFASNPNITPVMLIFANEFRIWMRVISMAQLASIDGTCIVSIGSKTTVSGGHSLKA